MTSSPTPQSPSDIPADIRLAAREAVEAMPKRTPFKMDVELAVARAILAERNSSKWQPIETAPKDGTKVLLWTEYKGWNDLIDPFSAAQVGSWEEGFQDGSGEFTREAGWDTQLIGDPTHWQPLPAAPEPITAIDAVLIAHGKQPLRRGA